MGCSPSVQRGPDGLLYVVLVLFNPIHYQRRELLFKRTLAHMLTFSRVRVITVELTYRGASALTQRSGAGLPMRGGHWVEALVYDTEDAL